MKRTEQCRIIINTEIAAGVYRLELESPEMARAAAPGQFAMLACGGEAYLRRPFSYCDADAAHGVSVFIYRIAGAGTRALSGRAAGEALNTLGPLGNGFEAPAGGCGDGASGANVGADIGSCDGKAVLIGGGIGVFPLLFLAKRLRGAGRPADVFAGYRDRASVVLADELAACADTFRMTSDDGSAGAKGLVTGALRAAVEGGKKYGRAYACGPAPMLKELAKICAEHGLPARASLEQRMGCGVGACLTCACAVKTGAGGAAESAGGGAAYARVCKDGPVFNLQDVVFD